MKISYNWLQSIFPTQIPVATAAEILTDTGLEVEGIETIESIKGGLKGVVVGEVLTCEQHPNADKLKCTTVNIGSEIPLNIVCGAPNVAKGQKVLVATIGTTLYMGEDKLKIKKGKIRGEASEGMICAEDELGLGNSHDGIMVLPEDAKPGTPAATFLNIKNTEVIEIGLTPNRTDAMSHYGVARDLKAGLYNSSDLPELNLTDVSDFKPDHTNFTIPIEIKNKEACPHYMGVTLTNITVGESPNWLKERLTAIGISPINNVVDATNYVLHEIGHPLHAFDADKISGKKVIIDTCQKDTKFTTLDEKERELSDMDLMIQNTEGPMCIAGVFGGLESGVSRKTKNIFIESAYFNPVWVRKTAKRHGLNTDASFRYERGVDPRMTEYALKRVALLIKEIAGGEISSDIQEQGQTTFDDLQIDLDLNYMTKFIGQEIPKIEVEKILKNLDIKILEDNNEHLKLSIPPYRVDVTRQADIIEEILRIFGYNNIGEPTQIKMTVEPFVAKSAGRIRKKVMDNLVGQGFFEIQSLSLTKEKYYSGIEIFPEDQRVNMLNPLSQDLNVLRQHMVFGGLEAIARNISFQRKDFKGFEFGRVYKVVDGEYTEEEKVSLWLTGNKEVSNWFTPDANASFFTLKGISENLLDRLGLKIVRESEWAHPFMEEGIEYFVQGKNAFRIGLVKIDLCTNLGINQPVYYAEGDWTTLLEMAKKSAPKLKEIPKFPIVKRDLSMLIDKDVKYAEIKQLAFKAEKKLLTETSLFDVYTGDKLPENKKSYAMRFFLSNPSQTLTDKEVEKTMSKIQKSLENQLNAELRA